jgi:hypothetical protein
VGWEVQGMSSGSALGGPPIARWVQCLVKLAFGQLHKALRSVAGQEVDALRPLPTLACTC